MLYNKMAWLDAAGEDRKILHIKSDSGVWLPYTAFPLLKRPDNTMPGASKGYATMQALLRQGWTLEQSERVQREIQTEAMAR
jgi:hypothetical protein